MEERIGKREEKEATIEEIGKERIGEKGSGYKSHHWRLLYCPFSRLVKARLIRRSSTSEMFHSIFCRSENTN